MKTIIFLGMLILISNAVLANEARVSQGTAATETVSIKGTSVTSVQIEGAAALALYNTLRTHRNKYVMCLEQRNANVVKEYVCWFNVDSNGKLGDPMNNLPPMDIE